MAKTGAEIQKAYRARKQEMETGDKRFDGWLSWDCFVELYWLARHAGTTRRQVIESAVHEAHKAATANMTDAEKAHYLRPVEHKDVTG